jgi:2-keto-4-pentenoate hydratase/2-oxohepta-3-ene-1,7-dioic acid hydratase in catechol pathway
MNANNFPSFNIYCIGRNYLNHVRELNNARPVEPVVFLKSTASLRGLTANEIAFPNETFHHEAEVVLRIGKECPLHSRPGISAIADVALGLDLTRRDVQQQLKTGGLPWTLAKSFAGSAVVGTFHDASKFDLANTAFTFHINNEIKQTGNTKDMLFPIAEILPYLTTFTSLHPGDLIYTGTPEGVGPIKKGDSFTLQFTSPLLAIDAGQL